MGRGYSEYYSVMFSERLTMSGVFVMRYLENQSNVQLEDQFELRLPEGQACSKTYITNTY